MFARFIIFQVCNCILLSFAGNSKPYYDLESAEIHFEDFIRIHNKSYNSIEEKMKRFSIFKENINKINELNQKYTTTVYAVNKFADITSDEFTKNSKLTPNIKSGYEKYCVPYDLDHLKEAPDEFDWRSKNVVTPVRNQKDCGSCWAEAATGTVESQYAMKYEKQLELSVQQLVDCDRNSYGCRGGYCSSGLSTIVNQGGQMSAADYPYQGIDEYCKFDSNKIQVNVTGCYDGIFLNEQLVKKVLFNYGPLAVSIDDSTIQHHNGGIVQDCDVDGKVSHGILLVGYGTENNVPYWILKNSYGMDYGEKGYVRILRGVKNCSMLKGSISLAIIS